jgi:hypothetical protein
MKLALMQPYFFPYLGYYDLINRTDRWVVFDVVKYASRSWMNRNRILHPKEGWQYIGVPVGKHSAQTAIKDVRLADKEAAHRRIMGQLAHYRLGRAPFYSQVTRLVDECFRRLDGDSLRDLNILTLEVPCEYLGIRFDYSILSQMSLRLPDIQHPGQWALEISDALGASEYMNPPGGKDIYRPGEFRARGIALSVLELIDFRYPCGRYGFVERLSVLDVLMWNSPEHVKEHLDGLVSTTRPS